MRVLVVHNSYSSRVPSGENLAVADEVRWLREAGVEVVVHEASNDDLLASTGALDRAHQAVAVGWSRPARRAFEAVLDEARPDVVHVHNLFPLLSASVPWAATRRGLPVVWTAHNRRLLCVIGTNFRDGAPCHLCRPGWRLPGIRYACYADSVPASALVTAATTLFRRMARRHVTAVAISDDIRRWLTTTAGFAPERVALKHNGVALPPAGLTVPPAAGNRVFLFAGYLIDHKGVRLLLDAWQRARLPDDVELRVVGDGPLAAEVESAAARDPRITWTGLVEPAEIATHLAEARAVVVPSTWDEPFGRNAAEALAYGRPVITTGHGGLGEIVDEGSGWVTGPDPDALAQALQTAASSDDEVAARARRGRERHQRLFSPEATTRTLVDIYTGALAATTSAPAGA
jgi:glycosyltransferase involved in cell wall biosynthesis